MRKVDWVTCGYMAIPAGAMLLFLILAVFFFGCTYETDDDQAHMNTNHDDCKITVQLTESALWCGGVKGYAVKPDGGAHD